MKVRAVPSVAELLFASQKELLYMGHKQIAFFQ
jgi:hypothetical protein